MITSVVLSALLSTSAQADAGTHKLAEPKVAAHSLEACGFPEVKPRFDDTLQEDVLDISAIQNATDDQLSCVANVSVETSYYVSFPEPLQARYAKIYGRTFHEKGMRDAKSWLSQKGLISKLPAYSGTDAVKFARKLEKLCDAEGALNSNFGPHAISADWMNRTVANSRSGDTAFECLLKASAVAGFEVGFIGNELDPVESSFHK